jgi:conjugal transfer/entry exclusion protein
MGINSGFRFRKEKHFMKKRVLAVMLILSLCVGTGSAQFGGVVYDPTNYANAVLRYSELVQQLAQLRQTYTQIVQQYNLAVQMARNIQNMPARYRAQVLASAGWKRAAARQYGGYRHAWYNLRLTGKRA